MTLNKTFANLSLGVFFLFFCSTGCDAGSPYRPTASAGGGGGTIATGGNNGAGGGAGIGGAGGSAGLTAGVGTSYTCPSVTPFGTGGTMATGGANGTGGAIGTDGGSASDGSIGSGGVGGAGGMAGPVMCVVGQTYCEIYYLENPEGSADGYCVPLGACAGTPTCACVCPSCPQPFPGCTCSDTGGLVILTCLPM